MALVSWSFEATQTYYYFFIIIVFIYLFFFFFSFFFNNRINKIVCEEGIFYNINMLNDLGRGLIEQVGLRSSTNRQVVPQLRFSKLLYTDKFDQMYNNNRLNV